MSRYWKLGLERVREFNKSKKAMIYWVDEEDLEKIGNLKADVRVKPLEREYVYDPGITVPCQVGKNIIFGKASTGCGQR